MRVLIQPHSDLRLISAYTATPASSTFKPEAKGTDAINPEFGEIPRGGCAETCGRACFDPESRLPTLRVEAFDW